MILDFATVSYCMLEYNKIIKINGISYIENIPLYYCGVNQCSTLNPVIIIIIIIIIVTVCVYN